MKYLVRVEEQLVRHVIVDAESEASAEHIVNKAYIDGDISLDYDDFFDVEFTCIRKATDDDGTYYDELEVEK